MIMIKVNYFDSKRWGKGLGVGSTRCPDCKKIVPVMNEKGLSGDRKDDYLQFHCKLYSPQEECPTSEKPIRDLG
ncbi:hypothetical protein A3I18_01720 [Candidatus Campbellbacteria bacterium RIFCSPLOWO2_02_FULL_35_11]|uniref:Uncharacterized protein n=2 Tax=Candidatus Campbelliibacteriota TaxID=1752727 RepID=A0A1F5EPS2_9BACT|nr:MAG: hypothetical protein A3E89_00225 [Candidatus Campbellbacteria bacterium RIFCSPHIGHO2_12_FULL_35_10]OGD69676.1 MAG: hypothetical protein A3I18_01720 [Candidatus Campbellbacteria bacterium RIFCSPLOWO2_02_FULL_35_11]